VLKEFLDACLDEQFFRDAVFSDKPMHSFTALKKINSALLSSSKLRIPEDGQNKLSDILLMTIKYQFLNSHMYWKEWIINHIEGMIKICNDIHYSTDRLELLRVRVLRILGEMSLWDLHLVRINGNSVVYKNVALRKFQNVHVKLGLFMKLGIQNEQGQLIYRPGRIDHDFGLIQYLTKDDTKRFSKNTNYPVEHSHTMSNMDLGKNFHVLPERRFDNENLIVKMEASVFVISDQDDPPAAESKVTWTRRQLNEESIREYFNQ
jgi:hypothetical protein